MNISIRKIFLSVIFICLCLLFKEGIVMAEKNFITLPKPKETSSFSLEKAIAQRRSERTFINKELSLAQIGQLLWAAQGITGERNGFLLRASPSAGALYPLELYVVSKEGLFHYLVSTHQLELWIREDLRQALAQAALGQDFIASAPLCIVISAVYTRLSARYGQRGIRYAHMEAGHIAQNIHLQAVALGLGSVPVGAFVDKKVKELLNLPDEEEPLYIIPVGYIK